MKVKTPAEWGNTRLGEDRRKILTQRINNVRDGYRRNRYSDDEDDEPDEVRKSREVIRKYEKELRRKQEKADKEIESDCGKARSDVLFAKTAIEALECVKALEKKWSKS